MTTIVITPELMAADNQITDGDGKRRACKLTTSPLGVWGFAGDVASAELALQYVLQAGDRILTQTDNFDKMPSKDLELVLLTKTGIMYRFCGNYAPQKYPKEESYAAIGSGAAYAIGALDAGAAPLDALRISARRDLYTSRPYSVWSRRTGRIRHLRS